MAQKYNKYIKWHLTIKGENVTILRIKEISLRLSPNLLGYLSDQVELSPLLCLRQLVAYLARGEATLRTETQTLQRHILGSLVDASDDRSLVLQDWRLAGNQTEHHLLVIRHILQRLETARTLIVKLQIEGIHVLMGKEIRSHWVVSTLGGIARMIVATTYMGVDGQSLRLALDGEVVHLEILQRLMLHR